MGTGTGRVLTRLVLTRRLGAARKRA
jgi:hypothetical protein